MRLFLKIIIMVGLCWGVGAVGWLFTHQAVDGWYRALDKPMFTPPDWMFGVVWPVLYVLMGIAAGLVWNKPIGRKAVSGALRLFLLQLFFNGLWTPLFFGMQEVQWALIVIAVLWVLVAAATVYFYVLYRPSGALMVPYLLWLSYAVYLNAGIWVLNRQ